MKLPAEFAAIVVLIVLNLRGVKESVQILMPIFLVFLLTHVVLIVGSIGLHALRAWASGRRRSPAQVQTGIADPKLGLLAMLALLLHAYSLGAGTYTGLEAVSNSMPVIREPRVHNAKKTMLYMAISLAFMAGGLIVAYLLLGIHASEDKQKTMNFLLTRTFVDETGMAGHWPAVRLPVRHAGSRKGRC